MTLPDPHPTRRGSAAALAALPANVRGALLLLLSIALGAASTGFFKHMLAEGLDVLQMNFIGAAFTALILISWSGLRHEPIRPQGNLNLHVARGLIGSGSGFLGSYALALLPLPDATALGLSTPLFTTIFAVLFLGEIVRWRRWTATLVGFVGVVIMTRSAVGPAADGTAAAEAEAARYVAGAVCSLLACALGAGSLTIMKRLTRTESAMTLAVSISVIGGAFALVVAAFGSATGLYPGFEAWWLPDATGLAFMAAILLLNLLAQQLLIHAYRIGEASVIAPFSYTSLLFNGAIAVLIFQEPFGLWTIVGAGIVIASTLYITYRELKRFRETRAGRAVLSPPLPPVRVPAADAAASSVIPAPDERETDRRDRPDSP